MSVGSIRIQMRCGPSNIRLDQNIATGVSRTASVITALCPQTSRPGDLVREFDFVVAA